MALTAERLREVLRYYPGCGEFVWLTDRGPNAPKLSIAGTQSDNGYTIIFVDYRPYRAHRLAWLYTYGDWPPQHLDHINGVRDDNRLCNLRAATPGENSQNLKTKNPFQGTRRANKSGRWRAEIRIPGATQKKKTHLGCFDTQEEAHQAYLAAKAKYHKFQPTPRTS